MISFDLGSGEEEGEYLLRWWSKLYILVYEEVDKLGGGEMALDVISFA